MLSELRQILCARIAERIETLYGEHVEPAVEIPPRRDLGDLSSPVALSLARVLKKNPRAIATEIAEGLELPDRIREIRVEGAGYLNAFLDRGEILADLLDAELVPASGRGGKVIVEHTNINPNKAAHIGHLRNAVLGDVLARVLSALGHEVEIQNYIDDTGVQVADVVVGFADTRGMGTDEVAAAPEPFDYLCWDLYSEVRGWFEEDGDRLALRRETLHALESGEGERAELGRLVARRIVARHLATMARLGIRYDVLTHESSILGLRFFDRAFEALEASGAIRLEEGGKNEGCWVMPLSESEEFQGLEDPDKVIVRSDGTVTYVGKDIAYQLWKFGLLGEDFQYRFWEEQGIWQTVTEDGQDAPSFGRGERVINVIDARQSYLQRIVRAGLEAMGHMEEAGRSIHFAYEMVSLSSATAQQLGYLEEGEEAGAGLEMSGRKGIGVKADDLIDQLEERARAEIASRNRELGAEEVEALARQIAIAALRFFMVKATTTRVIAFDLDEALAFEGETGPYLLYSMVRAGRIASRLADEGMASSVTADEVRALDPELWSDDLWDLAWTVAQLGEVMERVGESLELSMLARWAVDLAQKFNGLYHKHSILHEPDPAVRASRLAMTQVFQRGLARATELLGLPVPERM